MSGRKNERKLVRMKTTHKPSPKKKSQPIETLTNEHLTLEDERGSDGVDSGSLNDGVAPTDSDDSLAPTQYKTLNEVLEPLEYRIVLPKEKKKRPKATGVIYEQKMKNVRPHLWKPGQSGNPSGRPRNVVKEVGERIALTNASRALNTKQKKLARDMGFNPKEITLIEALMLTLATSANPMKVALYLERTFGKVPNVNLNAQLSENLVQRFKSKLTDSELEAIGEGADVFEILLDKLPDASEDESEDIIDGDSTTIEL